jgi:hypothetical protein
VQDIARAEKLNLLSILRNEFPTMSSFIVQNFPYAERIVPTREFFRVGKNDLDTRYADWSLRGDGGHSGFQR